MVPQTVYTLLCHRDINMALVTLPRLLRFLSSDQKLIIFDDGSLTDDDTDILKALSVNIIIITRVDREDFVNSALTNYPICRQYREKSPFGFKLIDIPLHAQKFNARFTYSDSDIIYIKNCEDYFKQDRNVFLKDFTTAFSLKLKKILFKYHWSIPTNFNAGYFSYDSSRFDLDFVEHYLSLPDVYDYLWLTEQTCWALLFGRSGPSYCTNEDQFICREGYNDLKSENLAIHLIVNLKNKYVEWAVDNNDISLPPTFNLSKKVTPLYILTRKLSHMIKY
ncbi:hypothetical protein ACO2Q8_07540 [Larkinella sp. VNQ87]|uniref:hypothetical protein n=1 Tax=Larkinella sp. VNQ87 TaxID=3400921 RepID=UPI003C02FA7E